MLNTCAAKSPGNRGNHTNLAFFEGWAVGRGVYLPRKRSSWIANAWEIFAARPRPSLCEIQKFSSISRFEHESQKKASSMPRPRPRIRPRFSDLSFHQQPWLGHIDKVQAAHIIKTNSFPIYRKKYIHCSITLDEHPSANLIFASIYPYM
jgi:hypothetical protein